MRIDDIVELLRETAAAPPAHPEILGDGVVVSPAFLTSMADLLDRVAALRTSALQ